jgi:aldehyde dehydrogenase (NAD+)
VSNQIQSVNPYRPSEIVAEATMTAPAETDGLLVRATAAQPPWAADPPGRAAALGRLADSVASRKDQFMDAMIREVGKPHSEATAEVDRTVSILRYYAQIPLDPSGETYPGANPQTEIFVRREPLGVVLAICPWNFPLAIPIWKAAPGLAYGNAVLIKPAETAIGVADLVFEAATEAGLADVFVQLKLDGPRTAELMDDPRIAGTTFTGSTAVGLSVAERMARRGAPAQAEMGGQNAVIVLADADLENAADAIVAGAMGYAGQKCTATRRVVALPDIADELETMVVQRIETLRVGDPADPEVTVGPLVDAAAAERFDLVVTAAIEAGAVEIARAGGDPGHEGYMVRPVLLRQDDPQATVNQEETFGPLLTFMRVEGEAQAIAVANSVPYGLTGAIHSRSRDRALDLASQLRCGMKRVNLQTTGTDFYVPFGGRGVSSFGPREQGRAAADFFTQSTITTVRAAADR